MSDAPMRILHLRVVRGTGGGPDKTTLRGCQWLRKAGHVAEAFYMLDARENTGRLEDLAGQLAVPMHRAMETSPLSLGTVAHLRRVLQQGRFDILHTHDYKSNALAQLTRAWHRGRVVATAHGYNQTTRRETYYYALERACFRHVRAIICPTRGMRDFLRSWGLPESRLVVIPNGIETAGRERPVHVPTESVPWTLAHGASNRSALKLLYLGRLSAEKDVANLLEAASILRQQGVAFELTVAGDGPEAGPLREQAKHLGLESAVRFLGFVTDVNSVLASADVLVNPSRTECMPNSVLEAMWAGVPVVATDVGGLSEIIRHGEHGLLCPPRDHKALAAQVARLARDGDLAKQLAKSAMARVDAEFTFERRMQRVVGLYRQVMKNPDLRTDCDEPSRAATSGRSSVTAPMPIR